MDKFHEFQMPIEDDPEGHFFDLTIAQNKP